MVAHCRIISAFLLPCVSTCDNETRFLFGSCAWMQVDPFWWLLRFCTVTTCMCGRKSSGNFLSISVRKYWIQIWLWKFLWKFKNHYFITTHFREATFDSLDPIHGTSLTSELSLSCNSHSKLSIELLDYLSLSHKYLIFRTMPKGVSHK